MSMRRRTTTICLALAALAPLAAPSAAPAGSRATKAERPTITRVTPMRLGVGSTVTIRGRNFSPTRTRNTVIFRGPDGRSALVKPRGVSRGRLVLSVPAALGRQLASGAVRFKLRVLVRRSFGPWTPRRLSPVVVPSRLSETLPVETGGGTGGGSGAGTDAGSGGGSGGGSESEDLPPIVCEDGDLLENALEDQLKTDPCLKDTDGDGVEDGFEYKSALDLNNDEYQEPNQSLPYPGKRPYPNPLDPSDAEVDYDGDTLRLAVEQGLWKFVTGSDAPTLFPLIYSDGLQYSVYEHQAGQGDRRFPALPAAGYPKHQQFLSWAEANGYRWDVYVFGSAPADLFDFNLDGVESPEEGVHYDLDGDGWLSDEERDEDADGLINFDENTGRLSDGGWWSGCYDMEAPYYISYAGTGLTDPDSDGDGVLDGADDQDHDDLPNVMELSRIAAYNDLLAEYPLESGDDRQNGQDCKLRQDLKELEPDEEEGGPVYHHPNAYGRVNPFNPCLPVTSSRTCNRSPEFGTDGWAPFDESPDWYALN
jgi:hypothetical protein